MCTSKCNTMNAFVERPSESVHCYPRLPDSAHLGTLYDSKLFVQSSSVAIQNRYKHFGLQTCSESIWYQLVSFEVY